MLLLHSHRLPLYGFLLRAHGEDGTACAEEVYEAMHSRLLPLPEQGEYLSTPSGGAVIHLAPFGVTLRVQRTRDLPDRNVRSHAHVLQPLGTHYTENMTLQFYPDIEIHKLSIRPARYLTKALTYAGLRLADAANPLFTGTLPFSSPYYPERYPVVCDPSGLCKTERPAEADTTVLYPTTTHDGQDVQTALFGHLRECFNRPREFLRRCGAEAETGRLKTTWPDINGNCLNDFSSAYHIRLTKHQHSTLTLSR